MKRIIIIILFTPVISFAQSGKIDSLKQLISQLTSDTSKINELNFLSRELLKINNSDEALGYSYQAIEIAEKIHYEKGKADAYNNVGIINYQKGNYAESLKNHFIALNIREKIKDDKGISHSYNNIGIVYYRQKDLDNSLKYHLQSLKKKEALGDIRGMLGSYNNIGLIHKEQGNFTEALNNYKNTLLLLEKEQDKHVFASTYNNIGVINEMQGNLEEAIKYYFASLKVREEISDMEGVASSHLNIGTMYVLQKKYNLAENELLKANEIAKNIGHKQLIMESYLGLSELFDDNKNWKQAYQHHLLFSLMKDSIFNEESQKQITEMQTKYETEKKEQQIKLLNKDKEIQTKDLQRQKTIRNAVFGGLMLVLLFSFVLINRLLLIRKQKKLIEIEREKSEKLLLNILPKEIANELKINNSVNPQFYKLVTVMFTDFKGFTTIAEKMSAEELVSELDFIFKKFDEIISKYPIEKIKTIGDAYMCAGGLPVANTTNPMDVVTAALEIQTFMLEQNKWQLRLGIHTGSVIAGVVGDKKFAYDIWGDAVNTASRMESSGEAGKVNISGATYNLLVGRNDIPSLRFTFRGKIPAKNKGEIEMYFVEKKV